MPEPAVTRHGDGGGFLVPAAVSSQSCCSGDQTTHPLPPTCPALPQNQPTAPGRTPGGPLPASYAPGQIRPGCTPALGHRVQDCAHSHGLSSNLAVATRSVPSSLSPGPQGSKPNSEGTWEEGCNPREAGIPGGQSRIRGTSPGVRTEEDQMKLGLCPQVPLPQELKLSARFWGRHVHLLRPHALSLTYPGCCPVSTCLLTLRQPRMKRGTHFTETLLTMRGCGAHRPQCWQ